MSDTDQDLDDLPLNAVNRNLCVICQSKKNKNERLSSLKTGGIKTLLLRAEERKAMYDCQYSIAISRILNLEIDDENCNFLYHKPCYSSFTSKEKIERLRSNLAAEARKKTAEEESKAGYVTRSKTTTTDWKKCVFCQTDKNAPLKQVMSLNVNQKINDLAQYDYTLKLRVGDVGDLIASDVLYHGTCILKYTQIKKKLLKSVEEQGDSSLPLFQICKELRVAAALDKVLQLKDVWVRYQKLAKDIDVKIPESFKSRRSTFKEKLEREVGDLYQFFQPLNRGIEERQMLLIPINKDKRQVDSNTYDDESIQIPEFQPENNDLLTIVHAALKIRNELISSPGHSTLEVSKEACIKVVPDTLHLFLSVLLKGNNILDTLPDLCVDEDHDDDTEEEFEAPVVEVLSGNVILAIAQDIVYAVSKGKKLTPKHIGLGLTLHQATRSKKLVNLFHAAGHTMSYNNILQADTSLGNASLKGFDKTSGAVIPPNLKTSNDHNSILHITADNIDIITDTIDGKTTFHATLMVAFQRLGIDMSRLLRENSICKVTSLLIPQELNELCTVKSFSKQEPYISNLVDDSWYQSTDPSDFSKIQKAVSDSKLEDLTFAISRAECEENIGWTEFNAKNSTMKFDKSALGLMPIILNPAHELSTLNVVLKRCIAVADGLGEKYVVLTTDQALYCKLVDLQASSDIYRERVILRMGGLHISLNFLQAIGQHMTGSGLAELWHECGLLAEGSIKKVFEGKAYSKGIRAHKLTFQALWRILYPQILSMLEENDVEEMTEFKTAAGDIVKLRAYLHSSNVQEYLTKYLKKRSEDDKNFGLWLSYIDMVLILLMFSRGIRDGDWHCFLHSLPEMLPYMAWYGHTNYLKSLSVYIAQMHQLPPEVEAKFLAGDFGVLRSEKKFAQVDPDHAQEWVVGTCKSASGGILGITQDVRTLQRWALTLPWRTEVASQTYQMYDIQKKNYLKEETPARKTRDASDENDLVQVMKSFEFLSPHSSSDVVSNVVTMDKGTSKITDALLGAKERGKNLVIEFVTERLVKNEETGVVRKSYNEPVKKNKPLTLADLRKETQDYDSKKIKKVDRNFLHSLVLAYEAGRKIDLSSILKHELCEVPVSLAVMSGELRPAEKASLAKEIIKLVECSSTLDIDKSKSVLIIDGMAFVNTLAKPANAKTFGELANNFNNRIQSVAANYREVHVVFDRYRSLSVKGGARNKREKGFCPVRRVISNCNVPVPKDWRSFLSMPENKADLERFLSEEALKHDFGSLEVVLSGGFKDELQVESTVKGRDLNHLSGTHEEADTRMVLHTVHVEADNAVVLVRDTDVLLLYVHHFEKMKPSKVWIMSGTARDRNFIPIHDVCEKLAPEQKHNLMAFHAITGCDSTSKIASVTKSTAWKLFKGHACSLLEGLGSIPLTDQVVAKAEEFVIQLYKVNPEIKTGDAARTFLFGAVKTPEKLPPTSDALRMHIRRCHYQVCVWESAHIAKPSVPSPENCGWRVDGTKIEAILITLPPIPAFCDALRACGCKRMCQTNQCWCRKGSYPCMKICNCRALCLNLS